LDIGGENLYKHPKYDGNKNGGYLKITRKFFVRMDKNSYRKGGILMVGITNEDLLNIQQIGRVGIIHFPFN